MPHSEVSFRKATAGDYDFAATLYFESTRGLLEALGRWDRRRAFARFKRGFKLEHVEIIRSDGCDIGWMQVSQANDLIHIHQLHLVERYRNRGIGTRLLRQLQQRARGCGGLVALNVIRGNRARALYERLGFRVVEEDEERLRMRWDGGATA